MARGLSPKQIYEQKFKTFDFEGIWKEILGEPERGGYWIIYGDEKSGKSTFALFLAKYLSTLEKVAYISAEEGTGKSFTDRYNRAGINVNQHKLMAYPYKPFDEYLELFNGRQFPKVVVIDNLTPYDKEIDKQTILQLSRNYPKITFIIVAHQERKEPAGAVGRLVKKLARRIVHVIGLKAIVTNRDGGGGEYLINEAKALIYHGTNN